MKSTFSHKLCLSSLFIWLLCFAIDLIVSLILIFATDNPTIMTFILPIALGVIFLVFIIYYVILFSKLTAFIKKGNYQKGKCQIISRGDKFPMIFSVSMKVEVNKRMIDTDCYFSNSASGRYLGRFFTCIYDEKKVILIEEIR